MFPYFILKLIFYTMYVSVWHCATAWGEEDSSVLSYCNKLLFKQFESWVLVPLVTWCCNKHWRVTSDGHDPLDTWPIPQPATISRASPAVASRSTFAQPTVASRSLSELSRGHRVAATARLRGGHTRLINLRIWEGDIVICWLLNQLQSQLRLLFPLSKQNFFL